MLGPGGTMPFFTYTFHMEACALQGLEWGSRTTLNIIELRAVQVPLSSHHLISSMQSLLVKERERKADGQAQLLEAHPNCQFRDSLYQL